MTIRSSKLTNQIAGPIRELEGITPTNYNYKYFQYKFHHLDFHYDEMGSIPKGSPPRLYCRSIFIPATDFRTNALIIVNGIAMTDNPLSHKINICSPYHRDLFDAITNVIYNNTL